MITPHALLVNPRTGQLRHIKVGVDFPTFLLGGFLGLTFFFRRLYLWGFLMLALTVLAVGTDLPGLVFLMPMILAPRVNRRVALNLLERGWVFAEDSHANDYARQRWGLSRVAYPPPALTQPEPMVLQPVVLQSAPPLHPEVAHPGPLPQAAPPARGAEYVRVAVEIVRR